MPQGPFQANVAKNPSGVSVPLSTDASNKLNVITAPATGSTTTTISATSRTLNITAATVIKASAGQVVTISVLVAGDAAGTVNDCATTGAAAASNAICPIPDTVGIYPVNFPATTGIVVAPGTGQTLAISFI